MRLVERNFGTAPNPIHWCVYRISLDTYSAKYWGSSGVEGVFVLPLLVAKNYDNSLLFYPVRLEGSYSYDTHTDVYLVSPTTGLDDTL